MKKLILVFLLMPLTAVWAQKVPCRFEEFGTNELIACLKGLQEQVLQLKAESQAQQDEIQALKLP